MAQFCRQCGNPLPEGTRFCPRCGAPAGSPGENPRPGVAVPGAAPQNYGRQAYNPHLVGFSDLYRHPEILAFKEKQKKNNLGCLWAFSFVPVVGLTIFGLVSWAAGDGGGGLAFGLFIAGLVLSAILWVIALIRKAASHKEKPGWEGVIVNKTKTKDRDYHAERRNPDEGRIYYDNYTLYVKTDRGEEKRFGEINSAALYNYFQIGDRVRYHPVLEYYEKYDKSHDNYIFCACCKERNPIGNTTCKRCGKPLLK